MPSFWYLMHSRIIIWILATASRWKHLFEKNLHLKAAICCIQIRRSSRRYRCRYNICLGFIQEVIQRKSYSAASIYFLLSNWSINTNRILYFRYLWRSDVGPNQSIMPVWEIGCLLVRQKKHLHKSRHRCPFNIGLGVFSCSHWN